MNNIRITESVDLIVKTLESEYNIEFSTGSKKFIAEVIENIASDPSPFWMREAIQKDFDTSQRQAIEILPEALLIIINKNQSHRRDSDEVIKISSWELWESLSGLLLKFCFIPNLNYEEEENRIPV